MARDDYDTQRARELRRDGSRAERKVWEFLRGRGISGVKFRRQHPIGPYFADFACISRKLVIEIDGDHHALKSKRTPAEQLQWSVRVGVSSDSGQIRSFRIPKAHGQRLST